jgi:hypothetical protein
MSELRAFEPITLGRAADERLEVDGAPVAVRLPLAGPARVTTPPIAFGATDFDPATIRQFPEDDAKGGARIRGGVSGFLLRNAVVHSRRGLVTVGGYFFRDFLYHVNLPRLRGWTKGCGPSSDGAFVLPVFEPTDRLGEAVHLLAGNLDNYYHWLFDVLARLHPEIVAGDRGGGRPLVLVPEPDRPFKRQSFDLLFEDDAARFCGEETVVAVERLYVVPDLTGGGYDFHPIALRSFAHMREAAGAGLRLRRRIYLTRRDSKRRPLVNEREVADIVSAAGFEIVSPGEMSVSEQIALFAEAEHIVAPHGAALANIVFAPPGASLLELQMESHVQWTYRRLAGVLGVAYGCLIGASSLPWQAAPDRQEWRVDPARLKSVLASPPFA